MKNKNIKTRFQNCNVSKQPFKLFCITVLFLFFCYDSYLSSAEYMEYELMQRYNSPMFGEIDTDLDEQKCLSIKQYNIQHLWIFKEMANISLHVLYIFPIK